MAARRYDRIVDWRLWLVMTQVVVGFHRLLGIVAAVAGVSLTTLLGGRELWQLASWKNSEALWTSGLVMAVIGAVWSATVAVSVTDLAEWQLIVMTTLACGTLALVHQKFPSPLSASVLGGIVATGSLVLLSQSWCLPIMQDAVPDRWVCVSVATWWLFGAVLLGKTSLHWKRTASVVIVSLTFAMLTPVFFATTPIV